MPRRPYHRVSAEDRQRIVGCFRDGLDYVACAERPGVGRSTAYILHRVPVPGDRRRPAPGQERRQASEARRGDARLPRHAGGGAADGQPTGAECDNAQHMAPQTPSGRLNYRQGVVGNADHHQEVQRRAR